MSIMMSRILKGSSVAIILGGFLTAQQQLPPTAKKTTERIQGASSTSTTREISGTVVAVEGNTLVVRLSTGEVETFNPPDSRKFIVDGQELNVHQLKVGTKLHAKQTTTQTSVTERTRATLTGKVWYVAGPNVILTLPNGENRQFKVKDDFRFIVDGRPATVFELRKGMTVTAEKIVEAPHIEMASDVQVTGTAPKEIAKAEAAPAPAPRPEPKPVAKAEPAPAPEPAPEPPPAAAKLPKTGSPLPLIGLMGLLFGGASLCVRRFR